MTEGSTTAPHSTQGPPQTAAPDSTQGPPQTAAGSTSRAWPAAEPALLEPSQRPGSQTALLVVAAVSFQAGAWLFLIWLLRSDGPWYHFFDVSDIGVYYDYAQKVAAGQHVYGDFSFEYPPLALPLFALLPHANPATYPTWFAAEMIVLCSAAAAFTGAAAAALWRGLGRPLGAAAAYALAVLAAGAITANRYDVTVALTLAAFLFFLARRHYTASGAALGVGVALKLTPGLLLPIVLIVSGSRRRALAALAGFIVFALVPFVPFLARIHGLTNIITYHAERPLQIESVPGTPYLVAGAMGAWHIGTGTSYGSQSLAGPGSELVARLSVWVGLLLVASVYLLVWRRRALLRAAPEYIPAAALACVLVFTVANKVLSPQFLCWTFPLVALVVVGRGALQRLTGVLTLVAIALTQVEFPYLYWRMVALESGPVAVVVLRNAVLVAAAISAAASVWRLPREPLAQTNPPLGAARVDA